MNTEPDAERLKIYKKSYSAKERRRGATKKKREQGKNPTTVPILKTEKKETPIPNAR